MAELMGRSGHFGSEVFNCSAPDTGNMGIYCTFLFKVILTKLQRFWLDMDPLSNKKNG
jgi:hypothetical protein